MITNLTIFTNQLSTFFHACSILLAAALPTSAHTLSHSDLHPQPPPNPHSLASSANKHVHHPSPCLWLSAPLSPLAPSLVSIAHLRKEPRLVLCNKDTELSWIILWRNPQSLSCNPLGRVDHQQVLPNQSKFLHEMSSIFVIGAARVDCQASIRVYHLTTSGHRLQFLPPRLV